MPATHERRRARLREVLERLDVEAVLITRAVNVRYLTGLASSNAALLLTATEAVLATDGRYVTPARRDVADIELLVDRAVVPALARRAARDGLRRLAFEAHDVTVELHGALSEVLPDAQLVPLGHAVEALRAVKDDEELALLREACAISDSALGEVLDAVLPGRTERSVARELESRLLAHGADGPAFETIVASGPHSAVPHHVPTERRLRRGDLLKIDFGGRYRGYHADCTRTYVVGAPPAGWQAELHQLVFTAQKAGREALAPGADVRDVDRAARDVVAAAGYAEQFPHGLGHGVGLEIHEAPLLSQTATGKLAACTPVTVEPGVYLPGRGGVRIEDTLVVRDEGAGGTELLTTTTKELLVLD